MLIIEVLLEDRKRTDQSPLLNVFWELVDLRRSPFFSQVLDFLQCQELGSFAFFVSSALWLLAQVHGLGVVDASDDILLVKLAMVDTDDAFDDWSDEGLFLALSDCGGEELLARVNLASRQPPSPVQTLFHTEVAITAIPADYYRVASCLIKIFVHYYNKYNKLRTLKSAQSLSS